jgi:hypothetical protein
LKKFGGESETISELTQISDVIEIYFIRPCEDGQLLRLLKLKKHYSIAKISRVTGHSYSFTRQQLGKFKIIQAKSEWDFTDRPGYQKRFPNKGKAKIKSNKGGEE